MGGWSAEREVSLRSGKACADALERTGYKVSRVDVNREIAATLRELKPDAALNVLHGRPGEDGTLQGMLEVLGIPYSHSGVLASALAMQKETAKTVLKGAGVPVPGGKVVSRKEAAKQHALPLPYVIKPLSEGSSVGVFLVREDHKHPPQELTRPDWTFGELVLVEHYIPGKELTCAVMGEQALGVIEIVPTVKFYDYEAKYGKIPSLYGFSMYSGIMWVAQAIEKLGGKVEDRDLLIDTVLKTELTGSPLGKTVKLDSYGNPIYDVQIRKVVKRADGKYWNVPIASYPSVSQFWTYNPETYMKQPPYSRSFQGIKKT